MLYNGGSRSTNYVGPMGAHLRSFGKIIPVVAGMFGEMNKEAASQAAWFANLIGEKHYLELGASSPEAAAKIVQPRIVRDWGCANVKARAQSLLKLLFWVGPESDALQSQNRRFELLADVRKEFDAYRHPQTRVPWSVLREGRF